jgi:hypothetical protein
MSEFCCASRGEGVLQKWVLHAIRRSRRRGFFRSFYYMIFDVSDAEAKRVAAASPMR